MGLRAFLLSQFVIVFVLFFNFFSCFDIQRKLKKSVSFYGSKNRRYVSSKHKEEREGRREEVDEEQLEGKDLGGSEPEQNWTDKN